MLELEAYFRGVIADLESQQTALFRNELIPALADENIHILRYQDLPARDRRIVHEWYRET